MWTSQSKRIIYNYFQHYCVLFGNVALVLCCCWLYLYLMDFDILALGHAFTTVVYFFVTFVACDFLCWTFHFLDVMALLHSNNGILAILGLLLFLVGGLSLFLSLLCLVLRLIPPFL